MDVAGLAVGIVALYTTCRDCYNFFTTVKTADEASAVHLRELEIQQSILKAWGFHWQIQNEHGSGGETEPSDPNNTRRTRNKLREYLLSNRFKAEGVFKTLSALADTLSDQEKLVKRYGIQFQPVHAIQDEAQLSALSNNMVQLSIQDTTVDNFKQVTGEVRKRLSVLNKFKWALKDRDSFKKLITDLRSHSESLYRLCPDNAFESMNIYLTMDCLAGQESPSGLQWTAKLALERAEADEGSSMREGYALLASTANLKASVNQNRDKGEPEGSNGNDRVLTSISEEQHDDFRYLGKGLARLQDQVVYVEMRDYRGPPLELTPEQKKRLKRRQNRLHNKSKGHVIQDSVDSSEDDEPIELIRPADPKLRLLIRNFFNTFQGPNKMKSVYGLDIAGIFDHAQGEHKGHYSIFYKLPGDIGIETRNRPAENLKLRAPVTLKSLIAKGRERKGIQSSLGARFNLARKLVRAVCLLHSSGWLHKNIRAKSVIFFPEHVNKLQADQYELKIEIDVSNPILMGYIFSRPDDITSRLDPSPAPETDTDTPIRITTTSTIEPKRHPNYPYIPSDKTSVWLDPREVGIGSKFGNGLHPTNTIYGFDAPTKAKPREANVSGFKLDYYQHPAKHADPMRLYRHAYDVYSLGVLLLEIGLWKIVGNYRDRFGVGEDNEEDYYEQRRWICRSYLDELRWVCGDTYADVVLNCLMVDSSDDEVAKATERELCARIVADLEGCQA